MLEATSRDEAGARPGAWSSGIELRARDLEFMSHPKVQQIAFTATSIIDQVFSLALYLQRIGIRCREPVDLLKSHSDLLRRSHAPYKLTRIFGAGHLTPHQPKDDSTSSSAQNTTS